MKVFFKLLLENWTLLSGAEYFFNGHFHGSMYQAVKKLIKTAHYFVSLILMKVSTYKSVGNFKKRHVHIGFFSYRSLWDTLYSPMKVIFKFENLLTR